MAQQQFEYIDLTGTIIPDTEDTRDNVANEFKSVFGSDLNVDSQTPQGVLMNLITLERNSVLRNNAQLANQINPDIAGGVFLDAIWALMGGQRSVGKSSFVVCDLTGVPGTPIPAGTTAKSTLGDVFISDDDAVLDVTGFASVIFKSEVLGPINAPPGTITEIVTQVLGWETITNPNQAILGSEIESDGQARVDRRNSLALQGNSTGEAIVSSLIGVPGVKGKPKFLENITSIDQSIENVFMLGHSIFVCIDGGDDYTIADILMRKKSSGSNFNGDTTVPYTVPVSGQIVDVKFSRPGIIPVLVKVTIGKSVTPDPVNAVKTAILAYANGELDNVEGLIIGQDVETAELSKSIGILFPDIFIVKTEISLTMPIDYVCDTISIEAFQRAVIYPSSIEVVQI
jgi:hypothetical protein